MYIEVDTRHYHTNFVVGSSKEATVDAREQYVGFQVHLSALLANGLWGGVGGCVVGHQREYARLMLALQLVRFGIIVKGQRLLSQFLHAVHDGAGGDTQLGVVVAVHKRYAGYEVLFAITCGDGHLPVLDVEKEAVEDGHTVFCCHHFAGSCETTIQSRAGYNEFHTILII